MSARPSSTTTGGISRVPYLPGLDGLRAIAVVGVMIYHANHDWLAGGYLGVEVFFVISGYLITLLLLGEHEKNGFVNLGQFWLRRARRLLPALFVMMAAVAVYITAFFPETRYDARGDFLGGIFYVSNWYQIWVGQGYAAGEAFVPLRHLWSLAVEEQFYLLWPLVMVLVLRRYRHRLPSVGLRFIGASLAITGLVAVLFVSGPVATACSDQFSTGCWSVGDRYINVNEMLYLGSVSRAGGLLLGAGFAILWRPVAILRGPLRDKGRRLDALAVLGLALLVLLMATMYLEDASVYNPWLYRGGLFLTGISTLLVVAAVTHQRAAAGNLLGNRLFLWVGTRSYGLYLYHWPIYQIIRKQAQIQLSLAEFVVAMAITGVVTEVSYRFIETPIRTGRLGAMVAAVRSDPRRIVAAGAVGAVLVLSAFSLGIADDHCVGDVQCSLAHNTTPDETVPATEPSLSPGDTTGTTAITTTTVPKEPQKYVAIGESVMVGAVDQLQMAAVYVDAKENRGPEGVKNTVIKLRDAGEIGAGTAIVIQVGTNAPMSSADIAAIMVEVPPTAGPVLFMTLHADVAWIAGNNDLLRSLPSTYPNVQLIDWDAQAANTDLCPDGIHISCNGTGPAVFYANLILAGFGLPLIA